MINESRSRGVPLRTTDPPGISRSPKKKLREGEAPPPMPEGSIPRVSKLMALAIRSDGLVREGKVRDYAELAPVGRVSRARLTQIMNLLSLAPDIQDEILFLPGTVSGRDAITEHDLRAVPVEVEWVRQRKIWGVSLPAAAPKEPRQVAPQNANAAHSVARIPIVVRIPL